jgi:hypothetical protein
MTTIHARMMMINKDHAKRGWLGFFRDTNPTYKSTGCGKPRKPLPIDKVASRKQSEALPSRKIGCGETGENAK